MFPPKWPKFGEKLPHLVNLSGNKFFAKSNLTSHEALKIATAAKLAKCLDCYVSWCQAAFEAAKSEGKDKKYLKHIK